MLIGDLGSLITYSPFQAKHDWNEKQHLSLMSRVYETRSLNVSEKLKENGKSYCTAPFKWSLTYINNTEKKVKHILHLCELCRELWVGSGRDLPCPHPWLPAYLWAHVPSLTLLLSHPSTVNPAVTQMRCVLFPAGAFTKSVTWALSPL